MPKPGEPTRHVELERKFDVAEGVGQPSFDGLLAVTRTHRLPTQTLQAVYFDTAEHHLAARRITLRRRTGGPDAGWHLKLPSGSEARTEVRAALGSGTGTADIPEELLDVVLAIVRDRALIPVARIATTRDVTVIHGFDDVALAEFCDDAVSAARIDPTGGGSVDEQSWREWELELVDSGSDDAAGLLNRLGNRLLDAGATPAGHGSKLAKVLGDSTPPRASVPTDPVHRAVAEQVELLLVWDRAVRADADDAVHQMRVATRQIRSLLQASEAAFGLTDDASILSELRELAAILGIARDAEVLADRYRKALDALPPELLRGPVRERLVDDARRRYRAGLARSWKAMRSPRYFRLLDALDNLVLTGEPTPVTTIPRRTSRRVIANSSRRPSRPRPPRQQIAMMRCTVSARPPRDFVTSRRPPGNPGLRSAPRRFRPCWAIIRTAWSAASICCSKPMPRTQPAKTLSPTVFCTARRRSWQCGAANNSTRHCANCAAPSAGPARGGRAGL